MKRIDPSQRDDEAPEDPAGGSAESAPSDESKGMTLFVVILMIAIWLLVFAAHL